MPIIPDTRRRSIATAAGAALLVIGGGVGALAVAATRPSVQMAPSVPTAIRSLPGKDGSIVTIRGRVAEVYGGKFVLVDGSGRMLVDAGPADDDAARVTAGQPVTVQGRFDDGIVHAAFLVGADGTGRALGPVGGPPRPGPRHGPGPGPRERHDAPPPPPASAPAAAPAIAPAAAGDDAPSAPTKAQ